MGQAIRSECSCPLDERAEWRDAGAFAASAGLIEPSAFTLSTNITVAEPPIRLSVRLRTDNDMVICHFCALRFADSVSTAAVSYCFVPQASGSGHEPLHTRRFFVSYAFIASTLLGLGAFVTHPNESNPKPLPDLVCTLRFSLSRWSFSEKHTEGGGVVTCLGGETARVRIVARGAGLSSATSHVDGGSGTFTDVHDFADILGTYTDDAVCRRAARCQDAQVLRKGDILLTLSGRNKDIDLAMGLGEFTLTRGR